MIFISVQPDDVNGYFIWQLQVQLFNFKKLGVDLSNVQCIFCGEIGQTSPSQQYLEFANSTEAKVFWYEDKRTFRRYIPSIRPHALKQHFLQFPELKNEVLFYHDADIIFRELPNFEKLCSDDIWYLSDTNSYINADYIKSKGDTILNEMCSIVGIDPSVVEYINKDSGGAQYMLKGVDADFWAKVEWDCEKLYSYMLDTKDHWATKFAQKSGLDKSQYHEIQAWTADMWAVLWNIVKRGHQVKVVPELAFSWATDGMTTYNSKKIFHNAGVTAGDNKRLFYKGDYIHKSPFGEDFSFVDQNFASSAYVNEIVQYVKSKEN